LEELDPGEDFFPWEDLEEDLGAGVLEGVLDGEALA
jgi:hypothetical protein